MTRRLSATLCAFALIAVLTVPASSQDITKTDLMVAARAIGFIQNLPAGTISVGIVYDPGTALSEQQAQQLNALFGGGLRSGNLILRPVLLPIAELKHTKPNLYFLTEGVGAAAEQVGDASKTRKVPCVTFDLEQVRNGNCTMGVRAEPRIQIIVNRSAANASGTEFTSVFRFMITEI